MRRARPTQRELFFAKTGQTAAYSPLAGERERNGQNIGMEYKKRDTETGKEGFRPAKKAGNGYDRKDRNSSREDGVHKNANGNRGQYTGRTGRGEEGKKPFGDGGRKPYGTSERKSYDHSDRKSYSDQGRKPSGASDRKPYGAHPANGKKPYRSDRTEWAKNEDVTASFPEELDEAFSVGEETENVGTDNTGIHGDYENGAVIGRNAVRELLKSERSIDKILVQRGERTGSITVLVAEAIGRGIPVIEVERAKLDSLAGFAPHQGIIAMAAEKEYCEVEDILRIAEERGEAPLIVIADGITDPYNLGALIRCAEGVGAHGLIIPKRHAAGLTPLVTKASAGAIEHLAIAKVANLNNTIRKLKESGVWVYAAEAGGQNYYDCDFSGPCALVFGSEGDGVSRMVKENSDAIVSIPMYGHVNSFNVSTAGAVLLAEASRQHHLTKN